MRKKLCALLLITILCVSSVVLSSCSSIVASEKSVIGTWTTKVNTSDLINDTILQLYNIDDSINIEIPISLTFEDSKNAKFKINVDSLVEIVNDLLAANNIDAQGIDIPYMINSFMQYIFKDVPDDAGEFHVSYTADRKLEEIKLYSGDLEIAILSMDSDGRLVVKKGFVGEGIKFEKQ